MIPQVYIIQHIYTNLQSKLSAKYTYTYEA